VGIVPPGNTFNISLRCISEARIVFSSIIAPVFSSKRTNVPCGGCNDNNLVKASDVFP
jgi:hypothetical protein